MFRKTDMMMDMAMMRGMMYMCRMFAYPRSYIVSMDS